MEFLNQMWLVRPAKISDLATIYALQDTPFREEVLDSELPTYEHFLQERQSGLSTGQEKLFLVEESSEPRAFISFVLVSDFWQVTVWGRWLRTLVFAGSILAFDHLFFPRLVFCVRENNRRMIKICEEYSFRLIGENNVIVALKDPPYIGVARLHYYDFTADEFYARSELMAQRSIQLEFRLED